MKIDRDSSDMRLMPPNGDSATSDFQAAISAQGKATYDQCQYWYDDVIADAEIALMKAQDIMTGFMPNTRENRLDLFGEITEVQNNITNFIEDCREHLTSDQLRELQGLRGQLQDAKQPLLSQGTPAAIEAVFKVLGLVINTLRPRVPAF